MGEMSSFRTLVFSTAAMAIGGASFAEEADGFHVSDIAFHEANWAYIPILEVVNGVATTDSVFMVDKNYETKPDKIVCVLYVRDASSPDGWTKKAWWESDLWAAVAYLKDSYGISGEEDYRWGVRPLSTGGTATTAGAPQPYAQGVLENDPLSMLTADPLTHDVIVSVLEHTDYKSADVPIEQTGASAACDSAAKVDVVALAASMTALKDDGETRTAAEAISAGLAASGCAATVAVIVPISTKPMGPAGPWSTVPSCGPSPNVPSGYWECFLERRQRFTRKRTCAVGAPPVYCDQWTIIDCVEYISCPSPMFAPCTPVLPVPATTRITLGPDDGAGTPRHCTNGGWVGNSPSGCTCP